MRYIQRDLENKIIGDFSLLQPGIAEELMDESDSEYVTWKTEIQNKILETEALESKKIETLTDLTNLEKNVGNKIGLAIAILAKEIVAIRQGDPVTGTFQTLVQKLLQIYGP